MVQSRDESLEAVMCLEPVHVQVGDEIDDANGPGYELPIVEFVE